MGDYKDTEKGVWIRCLLPKANGQDAGVPTGTIQQHEKPIIFLAILELLAVLHGDRSSLLILMRYQTG